MLGRSAGASAGTATVGGGVAGCSRDAGACEETATSSSGAGAGVGDAASAMPSTDATASCLTASGPPGTACVYPDQEELQLHEHVRVGALPGHEHVR